MFTQIERAKARLAAPVLAVAVMSLGLVSGAAQAQSPAPGRLSPHGGLDASFTYQGQLRKDGQSFTGACDMRFDLWDAESGGSQVGGAQTLSGVTVAGGMFTVRLNDSGQFGANAFTGDGRWLEASVLCGNDAVYTTLSPRTALSATPYALGLRPGAIISGTDPVGLQINTPNGNALVGYTRANGYAAIYGSDSSPSGGFGVAGVGVAGPGVLAQSTYSAALVAKSSSGTGAIVNSAFDAGMRVTAGYEGIIVESNWCGLCVKSYLSGVQALSYSSTGVAGAGGPGSQGVAGYNSNPNSIGAMGYVTASGSTGVWGQSSSAIGVYGQGGTYAGYFAGNALVTGNLSKGGGSFKIDHPLDPANKYLYHSFVESPDMMNIYNGNITTDANGFAVAELPDWFEALNKDFRYQLTVVGQFAQAIVAREIEKNAFTIQTDKPTVKVSWQVTGIRKDPYANAHRIPVEEEKPPEEHGRYLHPDAYGLSASKGMNPAPAPVPLADGGR